MRVDVSISEYRQRRRSGSGDPAAKRIDIGPITIWFSYTTPIAFMVQGRDKVVRQNEWSVSTGRHLNLIDGGSAEARRARVTGAEFVRRLEESIGQFFWPRDLDKDCPPGIVADWLQDRGLDRVAEIIRETEDLLHPDVNYVITPER